MVVAAGVEDQSYCWLVKAYDEHFAIKSGEKFHGQKNKNDKRFNFSSSEIEPRSTAFGVELTVAN